MKTSIKYHDGLGIASFYLILLISFSLPFYRQISVYLCALWIIILILDGRFRQKFNLKKNWKLLSVICGFYLLHFVGILYSTNQKAAWFDVQVKLPLLIMPLIMLGSSENLKKNSYKVLLAFVGGNFLASAICLIAATVRSYSMTEFGWVFNSELMDHNYSFWQMLANGGNNYMYGSLSIFIHPGYYSVYVVFCIAILIDFLISRKIGLSKWSIILYILLIIYLSIFIYLLFARAGLIALFLVLAGYAIVIALKSRQKWLYIFFILMIIIGGFFVMSRNGRMKNSYNEVMSYFKVSEQNLSSDNRLLLWSNAAEIVKNNPVLGVGTGDTKNALYSVQKKNNLEKARIENLNVHNQFLETAVQLGIVGFLLLSAVFLLPIICSFRKRNYLFIFFLLICGLFFIFESALNTQAGSFYFAFFLAFFLFGNNKEKINRPFAT